MGGGKGSSQVAAPPPPPAAPPPPTQVQAARAVQARVGVRPSAGAPQAENIRNIGGGRGLDTAGTQRALKGLTGQ